MSEEPRDTTPFCEDSEKGILSCLLQDPSLIDEAAAVLTSGHFYAYVPRTVWETILAQHTDGQPVDVVTITGRLRDGGMLDRVGGNAVISELYTFVPIAAHFRFYLDRLILMFTKRAAIRAGRHIAEAATTSVMDDRMKIIGMAEEAVNGLHSQMELDEVVPFRIWLNQAIDHIEEQVMRGGAIPGLSTGIPCLDDRTLGICPGEAWIIAGGTSDGKTALAMQICRSLFSAEVPTAYYLTESSGVRLTLRTLASVAHVSLRSILKGDLKRGEQENIALAVNRMQRMPFYLRHKPGITLQALLADMRLLRRKYGAQVFFIDYIQRIDNTGSSNNNREQQVAEISCRLTDFASKTGSNVVMLSQLNENGTVRDSRAPTFDADVMLTISCPVEKDNRGNVVRRDETKRFVTIGKARNSERGGAPLKFDFNGALQSFVEITNPTP